MIRSSSLILSFMTFIADSFVLPSPSSSSSSLLLLSSTPDPNQWQSSNDEPYNRNWEHSLPNWSSYDSSSSEPSTPQTNTDQQDDDEQQVWLDTLASLAASEVTFMHTEADRADKVRQMQEWGFDASTIESTLGVNTDASNEVDPDNTVLQQFQEETAKSGFGMYVDENVDLMTVESHTMVEIDEETQEPIRSQMVYVDEHSCIGCTHCAGVAQSTFFMEQELGRARVFQQWGDDDETIQIAIETCPVDCIHYVPYEELVRLEIDRRDQKINFKARLVSQAEYGGGSQHRVGTSSGFTAPQQISGNMGSRCNNCPSRGCKNCPMYGVGKNPVFEQREKERLERAAKKRIKTMMEDSNRSVDL